MKDTFSEIDEKNIMTVHEVSRHLCLARQRVTD